MAAETADILWLPNSQVYRIQSQDTRGPLYSFGHDLAWGLVLSS